MKYGILIAAAVMLASCAYFVSTRFTGYAYIVDSHRSKQPVEGLWIEAYYFQESERDDAPFFTSTTDEHGYFSFEGRSPSGGFDIDGWEMAYVYSGADRLDTLGTFQFVSSNRPNNYRTVELDTFALPHTVWIVPRIASLGSAPGNEMHLRMDLGGDFSPDSNLERTYSGPFSVGQKLDAWPGYMSFGIQHWLTFGSREFGSAMWTYTTEYSGNVMAPWRPRTSEGDTVFLDITL
ncbi:MAG: hypothetical protein ACO30N_06820 [Schleiferiaceae bacterium]